MINYQKEQIEELEAKLEEKDRLLEKQSKQLKEQAKLLAFMNEQIRMIQVRQDSLDTEEKWRNKLEEFEKLAESERQKRELLEKALNNLLKVWETNQHEQLLKK